MLDKTPEYQTNVGDDDAAELVKLAAEINVNHKAALAGFRRGMEHASITGQLLKKAKKLVAHGEWELWVKANCEFKKSSAELYMRIATRLEIMPEFKDEVMDKTINAADYELKQAYDRYKDRRQLNRETLAHAYYEHWESARAVVQQIKKEMNNDSQGEDTGWDAWFAGLDDEDKNSINTCMSAKPVKFPSRFNRWENGPISRSDPNNDANWIPNDDGDSES